MLATDGGGEEAAVAAKLPSSSRHLQAFGVVVVVSIVAGIKGKPQFDVVVLSIHHHQPCPHPRPPE